MLAHRILCMHEKATDCETHCLGHEVCSTVQYSTGTWLAYIHFLFVFPTCQFSAYISYYDDFRRFRLVNIYYLDVYIVSTLTYTIYI
jgi:hypothetical protein